MHAAFGQRFLHTNQFGLGLTMNLWIIASHLLVDLLAVSCSFLLSFLLRRALPFFPPLQHCCFGPSYSGGNGFILAIGLPVGKSFVGSWRALRSRD